MGISIYIKSVLWCTGFEIIMMREKHLKNILDFRNNTVYTMSLNVWRGNFSGKEAKENAIKTQKTRRLGHAVSQLGIYSILLPYP